MSWDAPRSWAVEEVRGSAAEIHARTLPAPPRRQVWVHRVGRPGLVLGSTQPTDAVDEGAARAAGVEVARRRSGGGAVLVEPGGVVWVDVVVPVGDALWDDDVGRAFIWVGERWAAALDQLGVAGAEVHRGGLVTTPWSQLVCFGGLGPGEVTIDGAKVVGLAQRRTREGAWFQGAALLRWAPGDLLGLLRLAPAERCQAEAELADRAVGLDVDPEALIAAFLSLLPS